VNDLADLNKWMELLESDQADDESYLMEVLQEMARLVASLQARVAALEAQAGTH
jgi:hypothetical protein